MEKTGSAISALLGLSGRGRSIRWVKEIGETEEDEDGAGGDRDVDAEEGDFGGPRVHHQRGKNVPQDLAPLEYEPEQALQVVRVPPHRTLAQVGALSKPDGL